MPKHKADKVEQHGKELKAITIVYFKPTATGMKKYPEGNGYYIANEPDGPPCTCKESCSYFCKGECGCEACNQAYQDFGS